MDEEIIERQFREKQEALAKEVGGGAGGGGVGVGGMGGMGGVRWIHFGSLSGGKGAAQS